jgi:RNA polymerase sigma-70 factor (ECF subfamily)
VAPSWEGTSWAAIVSWYDVLVAVHDTPVVRLNRAVAVAERDGPAAGLADLDALGGTSGRGLDGFAPYHGARGQLLLALGHHDHARAEFRRALAGPAPAAVKQYLRRELERVSPE